MYSDAPLSSQGSEPYAQPNTYSGQSTPVYSQQPQPERTKSTGDICTDLFTSKAMKVIVTFAVFIICPTLMGVIGVLGYYFLFTAEVENKFACFLFAGYTFVLAAILLLVELRIKFIARLFIFLVSPTWRALFLIFLGTLSMATYQDISKWEWVGYLVGAVTIIIGVIQIIIGCLDKEWKRAQSTRYHDQAGIPQTNASLAPQNQYSQPTGYSSTAPISSATETPGYAPPAAVQSAPQTSEPAPLESQALESQSEAANAQLAAATAAAVAPTLLSGGSSQDAVVAAASNAQVRSAAGHAAAAAATKTISSAYDKIFEDE